MKVSRGLGVAVLFGSGLASTAVYAAKQTESATLKDMQTVGTTSKQEKHQQYDLLLDTPTKEYTCRSEMGKSVNPVDFIVGSTVQFQVGGNKGEVKTTAGKTLKCGIVRVADAAAAR